MNDADFLTLLTKETFENLENGNFDNSSFEENNVIEIKSKENSYNLSSIEKILKITGGISYLIGEYSEKKKVYSFKKNNFEIDFPVNLKNFSRTSEIFFNDDSSLDTNILKLVLDIKNNQTIFAKNENRLIMIGNANLDHETFQNLFEMLQSRLVINEIKKAA